MNYLRRSNANKNDNNLLRFRNEKNYYDIPLLKSNRKYINQGLFYGGSLFSIVIVITFFLIIQSFYYRNVRKNLEPFVVQHDNLIAAIAFKNKEISELTELNKNLVDSIISIRSSSAILSEISKLIPKSIILREISVKDNDLEIKGLVDHQDGLEVINLFIIELNNSLFIRKGTVKLIKASNIEEKSNQSKNNKLDFFLKAYITKDVSKVNKKYLKKIGSYGLFNRIEKIKLRGLIK